MLTLPECCPGLTYSTATQDMVAYARSLRGQGKWEQEDQKLRSFILNHIASSRRALGT